MSVRPFVQVGNYNYDFLRSNLNFQNIKKIDITILSEIIYAGKLQYLFCIIQKMKIVSERNFSHN